MQKKNIKEYIEYYDSFFYTIYIPVTKKNYHKKILEFDSSFLIYGKDFGLFRYKEKKTIDQYIQRRNTNFLKKDRQLLVLLDLEQFKDTAIKNMEMLIPSNNGELHPIPYDQKGRKLCYFQFDTGMAFDYKILKSKNLWDIEMELLICSNSNIWWDEIDLTLDNEGYPLDVTPPADNRFYAYRITPRFNSFLRDITKKIEELGGRVELDEHNKKHVTEKGILLDGKIIYQEDIDEGRVKLPEK